MNDTYLSCPDVSDPDAFAARVHGEAMRPRFRQDDIVICSPLADIDDGDDAFIRMVDGTTTFRRVVFVGDQVELRPRNPTFETRIVARGDVVLIAKAVYVYSKL